MSNRDYGRPSEIPMPTSRALPTHGAQGERPAAARAAIVNVEGPIKANSFVTQSFERNSEGRYERKLAGELLLAVDAVVETGRGGDTVRVRVERFNTLWSRYDAGDYGTGKVGLGIYTLETPAGAELPVWLVDEDRLAHPLDERPTRGPQRIMPAR
jgi:hypothetical protein